MSVTKLVDQGEEHFADILFGDQPVDGAMYMGLYRNTLEPAETVVLTDFDEPYGSGYSRKQLTRGLWTVAGGLATYELQTFLASGGDWGNITGYFLATTLNNTGLCLAICHFSAAFSVTSGKGIKIVPQMRVS